MVNDRGFLEKDFQQNFDTFRLQREAERVVEELDSYVQDEYGAEVESALLTRSGHYGMSLMADSALMREKYCHDVEAREVADLDLCITVSDEIQEDIPEIRNLFVEEDGSYGEFNEKYDGVKINPRILSERSLIGKLEKSAEEWQETIPESVDFPDVDGTETSRLPAEFIGYFHQGYTPIKQTDSLEKSLEHATDAITDDKGNVYDEIWDDVWNDFRNRIQFKPGLMNRNAELGAIEMAKTNSTKLDYSREYIDEGPEAVKMDERDIGETHLVQKLKKQLAEETELLDWFEGEVPNDISPRETGQRRLGFEHGPEPESDPDREIIRRRVDRFLKEHPDMDETNERGRHEFTFGPKTPAEKLGTGFDFEIARRAAQSLLGRKVASEGSEIEEGRTNTEISDF